MLHLKKIKSLLLFAVVMLLLAACQKEIDFTDNSIINPTVDFKVRTYTQSYTAPTGSFSSTFNLSYDASNRIISMVDVTDSSTKWVYTYTGNSFTMEIINAGILSIHEDAFLNGIPLLDSTSQHENGGDTTLEKYVYDAANHLMLLNEYDYTLAGGPQLYNTTEYSYDSNGNMLVENDNSAGTVTNYEYSTELNTLNVGLIYIPKNKNLTSRTTIVGGGTTVIVNHTYTFDSDHRITSETQQYDSGETVVNSYSY